MKQFYSVEPRHDLNMSNRKYEQIEYDINTLIRDQAELCVDIYNDCSDDEWEMAVTEKANDIMEELMRNGIWRNEFGQPIFMYC